MKKKIIIYVILGILIIIFAFWYIYTKNIKSIANYSGPIQQVNLKLKWLDQAQFAGNYVALEKGFYKDEGLKVNLIPFGFDSTPIDSVSSGKADFGVAGADEILMAREKGIPVKAIAVIYKINPAVVYSLKKNGIISPKDLIGKRVGIQKGSTIKYLFNSMLKKLNIDSNKIKEVEIGSDVRDVLSGNVDAATGYSINESDQVKEAGFDVNNILMSDYGINMYSDVIFTSENIINTNPNLVDRFLSATLRGWQYTIENTDEAVDLTLKYTNNSTRVHQLNMLNDSIPLINDGTSPLGWMDLSRWEQAESTLLEQKILSKELNINDVFTMKFLGNFYLKNKI